MIWIRISLTQNLISNKSIYQKQTHINYHYILIKCQKLNKLINFQNIKIPQHRVQLWKFLRWFHQKSKCLEIKHQLQKCNNYKKSTGVFFSHKLKNNKWKYKRDQQQHHFYKKKNKNNIIIYLQQNKKY